MVTSPVAAQAVREPDAYKDVVTVAVSEFDQGNFAEARECFLRAHTMLPNARTLRGLGMSEFELRNYVEAARYLEQALQSSAKRLEGQLKEDTTALLARTRTYLGAVRLHLSPAAMTVRVDGLSLQQDPSKPIQLTVGDHMLDFHAAGRLNEKRAIKIRGEKTIDLFVNMDEPARSGPADDSRSSAAPTPIYRRWWLWTSIAVVAAGGAVAAVLLTRKTGKHEDPFVTDNTPPNGDIQALRGH